MRGFFKDDNPKEDKDSFAMECARKMANAVRSNRKEMRPISIVKWTSTFHKLIKEYSKEEVEKTLDWYIQNFTGDFIPQAYSALSFKSKFRAIQTAMGKDKNVEISTEAQLIVNKAIFGYWPNGSDALLPLVVQKSMDNYSVFYGRFNDLLDKMRKHGPRSPTEKRILSFMVWLVGRHHISPPKYFVVEWMNDLQTMVRGWKSFNGSIENFIFSVDSNQFKRMGCGWSYTYCGQSSLWPLLMESMR